MNRRALHLVLAALAMVAGTGLLLLQLKTRQRLGMPGVRVTNVPLLGEKGLSGRTNSAALPSDLQGYSFQTTPVTDLELKTLPSDTTFGRGLYTAADYSLEAQVSVVLMGSDRTSIHRPEYCLEGQGWRILRRTQAEIPMSGAMRAPMPVQRFDSTATWNRNGVRRQIGGVYVFYFVADGQRTASHWERQWRMIRSLVLENELQRWAYVSFFTVCEPGDEDAAFAKLSRLIAACAPRLETASAAPGVASNP